MKLIPLAAALAVVGGAVTFIPGPSDGRPAPLAPPSIAAEAPVLVELFTSQGCSSCPPADALAEQLAEEPGLVVISRPVTYWDRLGWKDTLAREENTDLQRAYAAKGLGGRNGVYTPQIVVDGARGVVGSDEPRVRRMIEAERGAAATLDIAGETVTITGEGAHDAQLVLVDLNAHAVVHIVRGENSRRSIGYTNVVTDERVLADWSGGTAEVALPASKAAGIDRQALILREKAAGRVLAARMIG